ncbi:hypothetical protein M2302_003287 [Micromonospora sp. A200]|uniref:hypothetical protein n=1 Tax=Micromonospora sp. A200 TaxID=2940568 RepID=UPI00247601B7|nr:hypothetical protein [Micromonospora sp. A200]MDH6463102.1 hypothetical protein [Micromonospora sp. A200]
MMVRVTQQTGTDQFGWVPAGADWHHNAVVGDLTSDDAVIAYGFRRMADIAVENWITRGPDDGLFLPIVYTYRHAIELLLKQALREAWECLDHDGHPQPTLTRRNKPVAADTWLATHDLNELAAQLDACFAVLSMHAADKTMAPDVAKTIGELHELDPSGDAFRYSQVRKPTASTFRLHRAPDASGRVPVEQVNIVQLREVCGNVITYLLGAVDYLTMYREDQGL